MRYIEDGPFRSHLGDVGESVGAMLAKLAGNYVPIQGVTLKTAEIRKLNRAIDILEAGPDADGRFALEDEDFQVLRRVALALAENSNMARSAPVIEDILNAAHTEPAEPRSIEAVGLREVSGD